MTTKQSCNLHEAVIGHRHTGIGFPSPMVAMTTMPFARHVAPSGRSGGPGAGVPGATTGGSLSPFGVGVDVVARMRTAYQRDGRLAAAATIRQHLPSLSMTEALSMTDRTLGLRKPSAIF